MKVRVVVPIIVFLLLVPAGLALYAWTSRPQLLGVTPQAGAEHVGATSSIELVFSRPMKQETVTTRLKIESSMKGAVRWYSNRLVFIPDQLWAGGQEITLQLESGAQATSWLPFPMRGQSWEFTTSESALAYLWPSTGPADIYALDPVTGSIDRYTQGLNVLDYSASSDGRWFYFSAGNSQAGADLYRLDRIMANSLLGQVYQPEKLHDCGTAQCRNPVVSVNDQILAYEYLLPTPKGGSGPAQVWTLSLPDMVATPAGQTDHETLQPAWSESGLLAYYDRTSSAYEVLNLVTQERTQMPNQTGQPGAWSPNGAYYLAPEISYEQTSGNYETGTSHLLRYRIQDKTSKDISGDGSVEDVEAAYSPDGGSIAYTRKFLDAQHWSLGRQIWVMGSDGTNPHSITDEADYNHYDLAWSRDGSMLAFVRFNQVKISDPPELWMVNLDGSNPVQLVIGGYSPIWIP